MFKDCIRYDVKDQMIHSNVNN